MPPELTPFQGHVERQSQTIDYSPLTAIASRRIQPETTAVVVVSHPAISLTWHLPRPPGQPKPVRTEESKRNAAASGEA
jgi:hypothetical protein